VDAQILKAVILDMLSTAQAPNVDLMARFDTADWDTINAIAKESRLMSLLHHQVRTRGAAWPVPEAVLAQWEAAYRKAALFSLRAQATLSTLDRLLRAEGIAYAALKGAGLAWHAYPYPALRPMRDLDILVAPADTLKAYQVLMAAGFTRDAQSFIALETALAEHKHLPALIAPSMRIAVEVHSHVTDVPVAMLTEDGFDNPARLLGARCFRPIGQQDIAFLSDADALLHLITHAANDHRFNNGPVILTDIAMLLKTGSVDWPRFWAMVENNGWTRSCALVFDLVAHYHGPQPIEGRPDHLAKVPDKVCRHAAMLMLQRFEDRGVVGLAAKLSTAAPDRSRLSHAWRRLNPGRHVLQEFNADRSKADWAWWFYPRWLAFNLGKIIQTYFKRGARADIDHAQRVEQWLQGRA
jgi:hypothetical protein